MSLFPSSRTNQSAERAFWLRLCSEQNSNAMERSTPADLPVVSRPDGENAPSYPAGAFAVLLAENFK